MRYLTKTMHKSFVRHLRVHYVSADEPTEEKEDLVDRLARAVTLGRGQFKYWRRHRDRLGISTIQEEPQAPAVIQRSEALHRHDTSKRSPVHQVSMRCLSKRQVKKLENPFFLALMRHITINLLMISLIPNPLPVTLLPPRIFPAKELTFLRHLKQPMAVKISNVLTASLFDPRDMAKLDHGERMFCKIYNHMSARIQSVKCLISFLGLVEIG
ncbi:hypothetical protein PMIN01_08469 [Paraphaeosphaeria minitans]|uniref:Uncharacterized protein n=1 Tax=Paraphaeosphaeria minitans TaxID=565426 RepID=A0A9P6KPU5_9PLEO|nr:hypothetical protein PMIN01_08469 [Paraphaeosphaeria minitans]